jgi:hypothetical protein
MTVVAIVACSIGAAVAFSVRPNTAGSVLTGWGALYGVSAMLILARGVPLGRAVKVAGRIILFGLPFAGLYGLLGFVMSGYVGLIGGFTLGVLMIGWGALLTVVLSGDKAVVDDRPRRSRRFLIGFLLSAVHFVSGTLIGLVIYLRPGDYSWVSVAWLPGSLLLYRFGSVIEASPLMAAGFYLLLGGSVLAGVIAMQAIRGLVSAEGHGGYVQRLSLALLWGVWVPMPYRGIIFYWFESY